MRETLWTRRAEEQLSKYYNDLEALSAEKAEDFYYEIDDALSLIREFPEIARMYEPPVRRWVVGPNRNLGLFYVPENRGIVVIGLLDLRQSPEMIARLLES